MQEIKCPNCGQIFQVDETGYAQIVQQIASYTTQTKDGNGYLLTSI